MVNQTLVFDPIPFKGGSKVATCDALAQCDESSNSFIIATVQPDYWKQSELNRSHHLTIVPLPTFNGLSRHYTGVGYWANQLWFSILLFGLALFYRRIHQVVGASGPGIDMPLYILRFVLRWRVVQFIHGNVARSRSIGYCLTVAHKVFYLPTTRTSLQEALECYLSENGRRSCSTHLSSQRAVRYLNSTSYQPFVNGIPKQRWPTPSQTSAPHLFWAASLLKWKGLDLLVDALKQANRKSRFNTTICYIKPKEINLAISHAPVELNNCAWFEDPTELDSLRSQCNIFVSTSTNEPFGLSILEALACGMCVIIPSDGSYWDMHLTHEQNCVKYRSGDPQSLAESIISLVATPELIQACGSSAMQLAQQYSAENQYSKFANAITSSNHSALHKSENHHVW